MKVEMSSTCPSATTQQSPGVQCLATSDDLINLPGCRGIADVTDVSIGAAGASNAVLGAWAFMSNEFSRAKTNNKIEIYIYSRTEHPTGMMILGVTFLNSKVKYFTHQPHLHSLSTCEDPILLITYNYDVFKTMISLTCCDILIV